tara:strand:+ start:140 stop:385 length:246 start_codon:yes stop_codon:yes gene_type:complete
MLITEQRLRQIIKEEVGKVNEEVDAKSIYQSYKKAGGSLASFENFLRELSDNKLLPVLLQRPDITKENLLDVLKALIQAGK